MAATFVDTVPRLDRAAGPWQPERAAPHGRPRFLNRGTWLGTIVLFALFFVLTPYDLLSSVSGYSFAERRGEIDVALDTVQGGNMVRRVTVLGLLCVGVIALLMTRRALRRYHPAVAVSAAGFLLLAMASPLWGDDPSFTVRRVMVLLVLAVSAWGLARLWDLQTLVRVTFLMTGLSIAFGLAAEVVLGTMHPLDPEYRFRGLSHPNEMGELCGLFVISSMLLAKQLTRRRAALMLVVGIVGLGMLVLTKARGALARTIMALTLLVVTTADRRVLLFLGSALVSVLSGVLLFLPGVSDKITGILNLGRTEGADVTTLTGRTDLWHDLLQYAAQRPLLGYGYDSFWVPSRILEIAKSQGWIIGSSHSGYVDVLIGLGGIGCVLFLSLLAACLWAAAAMHRRTGTTGSLFAVAVLVWLCTNMATEVIWFETSIPSFIAMMVVGRLAIREPSGVRSKPRRPLVQHDV